MVKILGDLIDSKSKNGELINVYKIPALSKRTAKARAKTNASIKRLSNPSVTVVGSEPIEDSRSRKNYEVEIVSER